MRPEFILSIAALSALVGYAAGQLRPATQPAPQPAPPPPGRATAIGGIFFKCKDPRAMCQWYARHLGLVTDRYGTNFESRQADDPAAKAFLQWSPFPENTTYFDPSQKQFMINYRVKDLDALLAQFKKDGIEIIDKVKDEKYGRFCHIMDPEGNKIELWEPNDVEYEKIVDGRTK